MSAQIDESLLHVRTLRRVDADAGGIGYTAELSCGHTIWIAVQPPREIHCGACLDQLMRQIRQVQAHQEMR